MLRYSKLLLAAAGLAIAAPAAAQSGALPPQPTAEETAELRRVVNRGQQLFEIDRAARLTTRDMLARIADPAAAGIVGWVAEPEANGLTVTYYAETDGGPVAVYRGQVIDGRVAARDTFTGADRPALTPSQRRLAAARAAVSGQENQVCGADSFNILVVPPAGAGDPIDVYQFSPQTAADRLPAGGHYRTTVAADGSVAANRAFADGCSDLQLPAAAEGQRPQPLRIAHRLDPLPTEAHVLMSYWAGRPIFVTAGEPERLWGIAGDEIRLLGARVPAVVPPAGPGR